MGKDTTGVEATAEGEGDGLVPAEADGEAAVEATVEGEGEGLLDGEGDGPGDALGEVPGDGDPAVGLPLTAVLGFTEPDGDGEPVALPDALGDGLFVVLGLSVPVVGVTGVSAVQASKASANPMVATRASRALKLRRCIATSGRKVSLPYTRNGLLASFMALYGLTCNWITRP